MHIHMENGVYMDMFIYHVEAICPYCKMSFVSKLATNLRDIQKASHLAKGEVYETGIADMRRVSENINSRLSPQQRH